MEMKRLHINTTRSLKKRSRDLYDKLIKHLFEFDLENFSHLLKDDHAIQLLRNNFIDDRYQDSTILEISCGIEGSCQFVKTLIDKGADVNFFNPIGKKGALHEAVEGGDCENLGVLLNHPHIDVNIENGDGNTPLHIAAMENNCDALDMLLKHHSIQINKYNGLRQTALHIAMEYDHKYCIWALVKKTEIHMSSTDCNGQSCSQILRNTYPNFNINDDLFGAFQLLRNRETRLFTRWVEEKQVNLNESDGENTFLQYTCKKGLLEATQFLIENDVKLNQVAEQSDCNGECPLMIAARHGYHEILQLLVARDRIIARENLELTMMMQTGHRENQEEENDHPVHQNTRNRLCYNTKQNGTVLHSVLEGMYHFCGPSNIDRNYQRCVEILLNNIDDNDCQSLDLNQVNAEGDTALHIALVIGNEDIIHSLLNNGAYIGSRCDDGSMPITEMDPKVLNNFLDDCVRENYDVFKDRTKYNVSFNYEFLVPPKRISYSNFEEGEVELNQPASETTPLVEMSKVDELRILLKHPVLSSFIDLKWYMIRKYFWINIVFYLVFCGFMTLYMFQDHWSPLCNYKSSFQLTALILVLGLIMRELVNIAIAPMKYFSNYEKYLILMIVAMVISYWWVMFNVSIDDTGKSQIAVIIILLSWTELLLAVGRHPTLYGNLQIMKNVCCNSLVFFINYFILILGFTFTFRILFNNETDNSKNGENFNGFFVNAIVSIFQTMVKSMGGFDITQIPFSSFPVMGHLVLLLFIVSNLILFVSQIVQLAQSKKNDTKLAKLICKALFIQHLERINNSKLFSLISNAIKCFSRCFRTGRVYYTRKSRNMIHKHVNLFDDVLSEHRIYVFTNRNNEVKVTNTSDDESIYENLSWRIDGDVVKETKTILSEAKKSCK